MTDPELLRRIDASIERMDGAIERMDASIERMDRSLDIHSQAFERFVRAQERIERVLADQSDQMRANTQAVLRLINRLGPAPNGA